MVYGRYNELVNGDYFMVYKPTYNWGAPSCGDLTLNNADFTDEKTVIWPSDGDLTILPMRI